MTAKEQYKLFLHQLQTMYNQHEADVITSRVFESIAGISKFDFIKNAGLQLPPVKAAALEKAMAALLTGKPMQYVLGEAWFYSMKLKVNEQVLIPRPETEELVQLVLAEVHTNNPSASVLDIGTGSGCIAIAIKKNSPLINVTAIDVSESALAIAMENAAGQHATIQFAQSDFVDENCWKALGGFDIIVSNPPYIPLNEKANMDLNVTAYEPHQALFVPDDNPLLFYKKIAGFAESHLHKKGKIFMEVHESFAEAVANLFMPIFTNTIIKKDIFGKQRMIVAAY